MIVVCFLHGFFFLVVVVVLFIYLYIYIHVFCFVFVFYFIFLFTMSAFFLLFFLLLIFGGCQIVVCYSSIIYRNLCCPCIFKIDTTENNCY